MTSPSVQVRVGDLKLVELLLFLLPLVFALLLLKGEALVLCLDLLQLGCALSGHLILEHASHAVKGESLIGVSLLFFLLFVLDVLLFVLLLEDPVLLGLGLVLHAIVERKIFSVELSAT
ncbi:hypothetical protein FGO68_gene11113 [Halteria grandinella]|uniref:Uncharacterized protein n=1 Tax=Halteria grandinella TaxID=5974 RepID=A0A8J8P0U8_HALGN|nr:hypothetical protein FGO68_gene11113 [Halteria grandinella]